MKKIYYFLFIAVVIITAFKTKNQNAGEDAKSSKKADVSVPYKLPEPVIPLSQDQQKWLIKANRHEKNGWIYLCLLYTSDAADDLTRVDLGGRRIIKKKKK